MTELPEQKHSDSELGDLRARNAFAVRPPVQQIMAQKLARPLTIFCYIVALTGAGLAYKEFYIPAFGCAAAGLLMALFIFLKKTRSRHHAAFLAIISLLVLVLGGVYYKQQRDRENLPLTPSSASPASKQPL
ncbi:MAG: hypothetical protein ACPG32_14205 [Akkermansiaceae bacterium]